MRKKILVILTILFIMLNIIYVTNSFAANVCTIKATFSPSNPKPGDEVSIVISASEINEAISGVGFSLEYDDTVFDFSSANATTGWTLTKTENLFTILTQNYEGTTQTGEVCNIKLKVKDGIDPTTKTIKLVGIQVVKEDASVIQLEEISQNISIVKDTSTDSGSGSGSQSGTSSDTGSGTQPSSGTGTDSSSGAQSGTGSSTGSGTQPSSGTGTDSSSGAQSGTGSSTGSGTQPSSGTGTDSGSGAQSGTGSSTGSGTQLSSSTGTDLNSGKSSDSGLDLSSSKSSNITDEDNEAMKDSTNVKELPYTGTAIIGAGILLCAVAIISYICYRKYKNI